MANRKVVEDFWRCFSATDTDGARALLHEDVTWRAMGQQGGLPISGEMDLDGILALMQSVRESSKDGLALKMLEWTLDGERVAVEMEGLAHMNNGKTYNNRYHFLVIVHDGKILRLREYGDTDQVRRVFLE
ncbi:nuclear transport factor 2 family protein [Microbulbifer agarilyticus]|uniref:nuclear transport factor 2 family protein n=1 Tax=Microbulbifer agarilyticus TaxID=260552 RepID=UPI0018DD6B8C|nr:nuclear transport factor 2 family protein [Microbulbifer agarilyticus]